MTIKQRFRQSIRCGTGEAYFIIRDNPTIDFSKDITKAALANLAYDGQSEGDRAEYVAGLINLTDKKDSIVDTILKALASEQEDIWALVQLFELAAIFAKEGNKQARKAIYRRYGTKVIDGDSWCGQEAIVELDGIQGLKHIAATRGKILLQNPNDWEDNSFVSYFQERYPTLNGYEELVKASKVNPYIAKYLDAIKENQLLRAKRPQRPKYNYEIVKKNIENKTGNPVPPGFFKDLTKTDIGKLASDFLQETDPFKQEKYLWIFSQTEYPYDFHPILQIARKPNSPKTQLVGFACESLQYFRAKDIRQFAIDKLSRTNNPSDYLYLLVSNYEKGDFELLKKIALKYKNEEVIHSLIWVYIVIYKTNQTTECKEPLEVLYEKLNCGVCRLKLIEILHANGVLSQSILKEMEFDSYDETRELFRKIKIG